jgi:hypothetical protein
MATADQEPKFSSRISGRLRHIPELIGLRSAEEPHYKILDLDGNIEIREYPEMTLAGLTIHGDYQVATREGFRRLENYMLGQNATGTKIDFTSPFFEEKNQNSWTISFLLPHDLDVKSAPTPLDHSISIYRSKARKYGAIWYTGTNDLERVEKKANELILWLEQNSFWPPEPHYRIAQYDTPSTIRFFKRNEVQYPLIEFRS